MELYSTMGLARALYARSLDLAEQERRLRRNFIYMIIPAQIMQEVDRRLV